MAKKRMPLRGKGGKRFMVTLRWWVLTYAVNVNQPQARFVVICIAPAVLRKIEI